MKQLAVIIHLLQMGSFAAIILCSVSCTEKHQIRRSGGTYYSRSVSASEQYNNFQDGVLFHDVHQGLDMLWAASFKGTIPFKEHLAFFIREGLLICPNTKNTLYSASLGALPLRVEGNRVLVMFDGEYREVLGIIHTHVAGLPEPAPRNDFQYAYLGIHNYVMGYKDLYDAYKDTKGREVTRRLGPRRSYDKLPFKSFYDQRVANE